MEGAGLTKGGFHKQLPSKEDLRGRRRPGGHWRARLSDRRPRPPRDPRSRLTDGSSSTSAQNIAMKDGGWLPGRGVLGSDAARQGSDVKASFEAGIKAYLKILGRLVAEADGKEPDGKAMIILSTWRWSVRSHTIARRPPSLISLRHFWIGRSNTFGKPLRLELGRRLKTVNPSRGLLL